MIPETTDTPQMADCPSAPCSAGYLAARESIAVDLYRDGKVTRAEAFRAEVDRACGINSGPLTMQENSDYQEVIEK